MSLTNLQTKVITQPTGAGGVISGFIVASLRTWQWQTQSPCNPVQLASAGLNAADGAVAQIDISGTKMYLTGGGSGVPSTSNFYVFNITNPNAPAQLSVTAFSTGGNPPTTFGFGPLAHIGTTVYLVSFTASAAGNIVAIVDASNPAAPVLTGTGLTTIADYNAASASITGIQTGNSLVYLSGLNAAGTHQLLGVYNSSLVKQGSLVNDNLSAILLSQVTIYGVKGNKLVLIDVSTPATPALIGSAVTLPDIIGTGIIGNGNNPLAIDAASGLLYVLTNGTANANPNVYVYNVSIPTAPALVSTIPILPPAGQTLTAFFVANGTINITSGQGQRLLIYSTGGSQLASTPITGASGSLSGAIARAA